jgi:hypothetical protein
MGLCNATGLPEGKLRYWKKIKEFSTVLADVELPLKRRKVALKYLVHFVDDLNQPLHFDDRKVRGGGKMSPFIIFRMAGWSIGKRESLLNYSTRLNVQLQDLEKSKWLHSKVKGWADESRSLDLRHTYHLENIKLSKTYISNRQENSWSVHGAGRNSDGRFIKPIVEN